MTKGPFSSRGSSPTPARPRTAGTGRGRTSTDQPSRPSRPQSSKGSRPLKSSVGAASLSGQKQTVSVYRRIDSKPIENLDKEIDYMCHLSLENLQSGHFSDKTEQYSDTGSILRQNYTMISKLGRGGFAMVYLMRRREDGLFYAGKYQRLANNEKWDGMREAWLLNKLQDCKFVIKMVEFYQSPGESVIITEYLEGSDLFASLSEADFELTEAKCRVIVSQVLDALVYIHRLRVIHMDIKPNNILLASRDKNNLKVKIIDFGLAKELGGPEKERCGMDGTLEFMAPEVIRSTYCTTATDMWSLGVLIYMLGSGGTSPFWAGNNKNTQRKILKAKYTTKIPALEPLSEQIKQLIKRLIVLSPAKRLSAREALSQPWLSPDEKTVALSKCTKVETSMMRKYLARKRWKLIKDTIKWGNKLQGLFLQ